MFNNIKLDEIIHQPIRTKILALLINSGETDYTTIKKTLNLSDGHMTTHMRVLLSNEYVNMKKEFVRNKPKTSYKITSKGKKSFREYIGTLKSIIES